jgi:hypothetical protein
VAIAVCPSWFFRFEELTMTTPQVRKKQVTPRAPQAKRLKLTFDPDSLALPEDEIRRLVVLTTTRYKIEPFVRQLIRLMDDLKLGRTNNIGKLTRSSRDKSRATLFAAIAETATEGRTLAAYHTTYQAALYAYENTLDHLMAFHEYLDQLRPER